MNIEISELYGRFQQQGVLISCSGPNARLTATAPVENCGPGTLVFVDHAKYLDQVRTRRPSAVVTTEAIAAELADDGLAVLVAPNVRLAIALIKQAYEDRNVRDGQWQRVHPSAVIHASVTIPESVSIGPGAVIGANVQLGENVVVMANAVVENDVVIGDNSVLHPRCVVCHRCVIGRDCILKPGCVIGSEGFGFAQDQQRRNYRIPHTGNVILEDRIVIGANTTIDRGTYGATVVHSGVIIDALCHLGHNVEIGEDCILCAHTGISGSSRFGKRVIATGQTGVLDHVTVADDCVLLHRAGVNNSIKQPGMYAGGPTQPLQQYLKNMAVFPRLQEIWTRLKRLEKSVAELRKD